MGNEKLKENKEYLTWKKKTSSPFAIIYPLPSYLASRILKDKKTVFVKYLTHESIPQKLRSCKKLLLYISGSYKEIAGEAEIISINLMNLSEVFSVHDSSIFLIKDELLDYSKGREDKKMIVLELGKIRKYSEPKELGHGITMVGEYMQKDEYDALVGG